MGENRYIPELRFPEFSKKWSSYRIQNLIDNGTILGQQDGNHGELYPRSDEFAKQGVPYVSANDFVSGEVDLENCKFLPFKRATKFKKGISKDGDVLFAHNATVGPTAVLNTKLDYVILSTTATYYRCDLNRLVNKFLKISFETDNFIRQYSRVMSQSTRNQVPITTQRKFYLNLPSLPEQQKIADFLSTVDQKIQALTRKKELLEEYKKGVMQQLFKQEIRFKQEGGRDYPDWEEKRLGEVTRYTKGFAFKSGDYQESGIRIIRVSDLLARSIKKDVKKVFIDSDKAKDFDKYQLVEGNIIITTVGSKPEMIESAVGRGIYISNSNEGLLNQNMLKFDNVEGVVNQFLIALINTKRYQHYMKGIARGNANQANITVVDLLQYKVSLPSFPEQQKIATFLSSVDTKIESVDHQITQTQTWKKGLLQKMFV